MEHICNIKNDSVIKDEIDRILLSKKSFFSTTLPEQQLPELTKLLMFFKKNLFIVFIIF